MYDYSKEHQDLVFTVTDPNGQMLSVEAPWDAGADNLAQVFRAIMYWLTWSPAQIDEVIIPVDGWPDEKEDENEDNHGRI